MGESGVLCNLDKLTLGGVLKEIEEGKDMPPIKLINDDVHDPEEAERLLAKCERNAANAKANKKQKSGMFIQCLLLLKLSIRSMHAACLDCCVMPSMT